MSVLTDNSADSGAPPAPGAPAQPSASGADARAGTTSPVVGQTWREIYRIHAVVGDEAAPRRWRATQTDTGIDVLVRAIPRRLDDTRAKVWPALVAMEHPHLAPAFAAIETEAGRYEIEAIPAGPTIRDWARGQTIDAALLAECVRPLGEALAALHERGLGHFDLRPGNIHVAGEPGAWRVVLAGFERVTACGNAGLIPIEVDPFYAPPEAAGLYQHSGGADLLAWDWWSLGRVLQESVLGRHALAALLQRDVSRPTPELLARAEGLLLEREPGAGRAGLVEVMAGLEPRAEALFRGLLTTARDGRWGAAEVTAWLRGETPRDFYRLPRNESLFRWRGRAWTVADVAAELRSAEGWPEALDQLADAGRPGSLAHFIANVPAQRLARERLEELGRVADTPAMKGFAPEVLRDVVTAVACLELGGGQLWWRGRRIDAAGLRAVLAETMPGVDRLAFLRALSARSVVILVERLDPDAARSLGEFAQTLAAAESILRAQRWLNERDGAGMTRLFEWAAQAVGPLHQAAKELRERFACSTNPAVNKLMAIERPSRGELVVLVWLGAMPKRFSLLTHAEWAAQEYERLRGEGAGLAAGLFWIRLHRVLAAGTMIFGRWWLTAPAWLLAAAGIAFLWPGPNWLPMALAPGVIALVLRFAGAAGVRRVVRRSLPAAARWRWIDGAARSRAERDAAAAGRTAETLARALRELNGGIARIKHLEPPPAPVRVPGGRIPLWFVTVTSWLVLGAIAAGALRQVSSQRPSWQTFMLAWNPPPEVVAARAAAAKRRHAAEDDGPVRVSWPFKPGDNAERLRVAEALAPTSAQLEALERQGRALARRYKPETITTLVVLRVPAVDDRVAVMLYDLRQQRPAVERVFLLDYAPLARAWVEVEDHNGIYLPD